MDYDTELETIRQKAWEEYKKDFINWKNTSSMPTSYLER
jgi:hypothetical protein